MLCYVGGKSYCKIYYIFYVNSDLIFITLFVSLENKEVKKLKFLFFLGRKNYKIERENREKNVRANNIIIYFTFNLCLIWSFSSVQYMIRFFCSLSYVDFRERSLKAGKKNHSSLFYLIK